MAKYLDVSATDFASAWNGLLHGQRAATSDEAMSVARTIIKDVRQRKGQAVAEYTQRLDRLQIDPDSLQSDMICLPELAKSCAPAICRALDFAAERIREFHERQRPQNLLYRDRLGVELGWRWNPIDSVALYVPGGKASYPSSVLMNAIPAAIAGVRRLIMISPAADGVLSPAIAYAAQKTGIEEFYPIGGAQGIAALAFGAGQLQPADKIVGPGNAYVAAAKRLVFGHVGIDSIAGPSEICIIADSNNDPRQLAADLLAQAEHDSHAQAVLMTPSKELAQAVDTEITSILPLLASGEIARESWSKYGVIIRASLEEAAELVNMLAPEHLHLAVADPDPIAAKIRNAGAIFLGNSSPEVLGDYVSGPNHVLPTSRTARFGSGLAVPDFCTRTTIQRIPSAQMARPLLENAMILAEAEGLPAHAMSARLRLEKTI